MSPSKVVCITVPSSIYMDVKGHGTVTYFVTKSFTRIPVVVVVVIVVSP